ncbi:Cytochrome P450 2J2 [Halotydeus destructor]|nr:Cytochrome P450 2J2 [Halotydeus destructor]
MRHGTSIPINLPHIASRDTDICGYTIPKGYHIYVNFFAIHNDPNYWDEPETFKVERFLTPEGNKLVKHEAFMPFSTGRRSCPGEPLAQVELFVYLVMTLQRYKIQPPDGVELSLQGDIAGFAWVPKNLHLVFSKRH